MRLPGTLVLLAIVPLAIVLMLTVGLGYVKLKQDAAQQADAVGHELARQIASSVADPMAGHDNLSLNIILAQWDQNPLIAHTAVYTLDERIVAEAGQRSPREKLAPGKGRFVAAIHYQDTVTGQLHLSLAAAPFSDPVQNMLRWLIGCLGIIAAIAGIIAWRIALRLRHDLAGLGDWHGDSGQPVPGARRKDELGDLARRLAERRIVDMPADPEPEQSESEPELVAFSGPADVGTDTTVESIELDDASLDESVDTEAQRSPPAATEPANEAEMGAEPLPADRAKQVPEQPEEAASATIRAPDPVAAQQSLLAIRLGNVEALRRLPRPRLMALLERYRLQVRQASELYDGELTVMDDGTSVLAFAPDHDEEDGELTRALSCGELLRVLGHDLQVEISDTGTHLFLQLATCRTADPASLAGGSDTLGDEASRMLELLQFSRNLLLLDASLGDAEPVRARAVVRKLASQPGAYCVERLNEPHQSLLERTLTQLYSQP